MSRQLASWAPLTSLASAARIVEWLPAVTALAYVGLVLVKFPSLVRGLGWNSDAAGAFVLGELVPGHGTVQIPRFGWWTSLWWLLATRELPGHRQLWEATGYAFALATVALVCWATWRVAGRWAGLTAAAVAVVVGPKTLTSLLTVNFHTSTPFTAAVLAAYLVLLDRHRSWTLAALVGVLAGLNSASDPLVWLAGIAPFALAAGVLAVVSRQRCVAVRGAFVVVLAAGLAPVTDRVMRAFDFHVIPVGLNPTGFGDLAPNLLELGRSIALVFGANFLSEPVYPPGPLRYAVALLGFAGLAALLVVAVRSKELRAHAARWAYALYWATGAVLVCVAYWGTGLAAGGGPGGGLNYMLTLAPAAGVGLALLSARSPGARVAASLAVAVVGVVNISGIAQGRAEPGVSAESRDAELVHLLVRDGLTHGYAPYWDAQSLSWASGMKLLVAPVRACTPRGGGKLCRESFFTIDSWYRPRRGRSFVIVDPQAGLWEKPPAALGTPTEVHRLTTDPDVVVYVYPYDLARDIHS